MTFANLMLGTLPSAVCLAYIGPGAGLSAIGALIALVFAIIVAIFGFVWYPIRRIMKGRRRNSENDGHAE